MNKKTATTDKPLTKKQKAFADKLLSDKKISATQAVRETYGKPNKQMTETTAGSIAVENLRKPAIMAYLAKHGDTAENTLVEVMTTSKDFSKSGNTAGASYAATAISAANSILDRLHGKATQRIQQTTEAVVINIDLTGTTGQ